MHKINHWPAVLGVGLTAVASALMLTAGPVAAAAPAAPVVHETLIDPGSPDSYAAAINNLGDVVGTDDSGAFLRDAALLQDDQSIRERHRVESVDVVLDADFEWTEEDLADEYRSRLLASRARRRDATTDRGGSDPAAPRELPARPEGRPGARAGSAASERSVLITRRRRG